MPESPKDFEVLYKETAAHVRANANLPGQGIYPITELSRLADEADAWYEELEQAYPGYASPGEHTHGQGCTGPPGFKSCGKWSWSQDFGVPERYNPLRGFCLPYLQASRAEAMKGSEQVVRGFAAASPFLGSEGVGESPNLLPRQPQGTMVVIQNGMKEAKEKRGLKGLGWKR